MSILSRIRGRRRREREAYVENNAYATPEELDEIKGHRRRWSVLVNTSLRRGTGMSPTGKPIDFTADQKPPRH